MGDSFNDYTNHIYWYRGAVNFFKKESYCEVFNGFAQMFDLLSDELINSFKIRSGNFFDFAKPDEFACYYVIFEMKNSLDNCRQLIHSLSMHDLSSLPSSLELKFITIY